MSLFGNLHDFRCTVPDCATCDLVPRPDETHQQWAARIRTMAAVNPLVCVNGHPWTDANTYQHPEKGRICRLCRNDARRRHKEKVAS